jgi:hypothetical protein
MSITAVLLPFVTYLLTLPHTFMKEMSCQSISETTEWISMEFGIEGTHRVNFCSYWDNTLFEAQIKLY